MSLQATLVRQSPEAGKRCCTQCAPGYALVVGSASSTPGCCRLACAAHSVAQATLRSTGWVTCCCQLHLRVRSAQLLVWHTSAMPLATFPVEQPLAACQQPADVQMAWLQLSCLQLVLPALQQARAFQAADARARQTACISAITLHDASTAPSRQGSSERTAECIVARRCCTGARWAGPHRCCGQWAQSQRMSTTPSCGCALASPVFVAFAGLSEC